MKDSPEKEAAKSKLLKSEVEVEKTEKVIESQDLAFTHSKTPEGWTPKWGAYVRDLKNGPKARLWRWRRYVRALADMKVTLTLADAAKLSSWEMIGDMAAVADNKADAASAFVVQESQNLQMMPDGPDKVTSKQKLEASQRQEQQLVEKANTYEEWELIEENAAYLASEVVTASPAIIEERLAIQVMTEGPLKDRAQSALVKSEVRFQSLLESSSKANKREELVRKAAAAVMKSRKADQVVENLVSQSGPSEEVKHAQDAAQRAADLAQKLEVQVRKMDSDSEFDAVVAKTTSTTQWIEDAVRSLDKQRAQTSAMVEAAASVVEGRREKDEANLRLVDSQQLLKEQDKLAKILNEWELIVEEMKAAILEAKKPGSSAEQIAEAKKFESWVQLGEQWNNAENDKGMSTGTLIPFRRVEHLVRIAATAARDVRQKQGLTGTHKFATLPSATTGIEAAVEKAAQAEEWVQLGVDAIAAVGTEDAEKYELFFEVRDDFEVMQAAVEGSPPGSRVRPFFTLSSSRRMPQDQASLTKLLSLETLVREAAAAEREAKISLETKPTSSVLHERAKLKAEEAERLEMLIKMGDEGNVSRSLNPEVYEQSVCTEIKYEIKLLFKPMYDDHKVMASESKAVYESVQSVEDKYKKQEEQMQKLLATPLCEGFECHS